MSVKESQDTGRRAGLGLLLGLFVAAAFSSLAAAIWLWNGRSLGYLNVTLTETIMMYVIWGALVGVTVGILLPVTRTGLGAAGVGGLIMASGFLGAQVVRGATTLEFAMGAILGAVVGGVAGYRMFPRYWAWRDRAE
jgi:hypothetical protein